MALERNKTVYRFFSSKRLIFSIPKFENILKLNFNNWSYKPAHIIEKK